MLNTMRSGVPLTVLALVLLGTGLARAAPNDRTVTLDTPVAQLSSSSSARGVHHVAFITAERCPIVAVWRLTGRPQTLGPRGCTSKPFGLTLRGDAQWATVRADKAGRRVYEVWHSEMGFQPNREPYSEPERIVRRTVSQGDRAPIVMYDGSFWVDGRLPGLQGTFPVAPARVARASVYVVVQRADGVIESYLTTSKDPPTTQARYPRGAVKALKGTLGYFAVLTPGLLEVYGASSLDPGAIAHTARLPAAVSYGDDSCYQPRCSLAQLRLADFEWPYAVYVRGQAIHVVDVRSGKDLVVRRPTTGPVHAQMEVTGLTYSYGNRISYVGRFKIDALFRR